jgi:hypothetical protein
MARLGQKMQPPPNKMSYSSQSLKSQKIKGGLDQITAGKTQIGKSGILLVFGMSGAPAKCERGLSIMSGITAG